MFQNALVAEAQQFVGAPAAAARVAPEPVNTAMIRHWCLALDDANPAYAQPSAGRAGVIAPPAMLGSWTLDASRRPGSGPRDQVLRRLEDAGFTAVVATDYEQEYLRELVPGDHLSEALSVESCSDVKQTALGTGVFVTVRHDYTDQHGALVGVARMKLLKFAPRPKPVVKGAWPRPVINRDTQAFWDGVAAGELRIQRCAACGVVRHPPHPMCGACGSTQHDHVVASGRATVHSWAVHHHPPLPGIPLPHVIVLVELEEGVRMVSALAELADVAIGDALQVAFTEVEDGHVLPLFRAVAA